MIKIKDFLSVNLESLPLFFQSLTFSSFHQQSINNNCIKYKFIILHKFNSNSYNIVYLYKNISKI